MKPRFFNYCINEWVEVNERIFGNWWGPKTVLFPRAEMHNNGWIINRQTKHYGEFVRIILGELLEVVILDNPYGVKLDPGLPLEATRANADKIGYGLSQLFETLEQVAKRPQNVVQMLGSDPWTPAENEFLETSDDEIADTVLVRAIG